MGQGGPRELSLRRFCTPGVKPLWPQDAPGLSRSGQGHFCQHPILPSSTSPDCGLPTVSLFVATALCRGSDPYEFIVSCGRLLAASNERLRRGVDIPIIFTRAAAWHL